MSIHFPLFENSCFKLVGEGIYNGCPNPVETSGYLIPTLCSSEFPPGMEDGHNRLESGFTGLWVDIDRDTTTIILNGNGVVLVESDDDMRRISCHRLIDRVIDDLPHEVMETTLIGRTDVHTRTFTDGLKPLEDLDITGIVRICRHKKIGVIEKSSGLYEKSEESKAKSEVFY